MPSSSPPVELLAALAGVLRDLRAGWYVFGAQAVTLWGRPRLTADIDVTVRLEPDDRSRFTDAMARAGFALRADATPEFVAVTRVLPFVHDATGWPLDVVLAGPGLEQQFIEAAVHMDIGGGVRVPFIRAEDLIVTKILAGRPKDLDDVRGILLEQGERLDVGSSRDTLTRLESALGVSNLVSVLDAELARARGKRA